MAPAVLLPCGRGGLQPLELPIHQLGLPTFLIPCPGLCPRTSLHGEDVLLVLQTSLVQASTPSVTSGASRRLISNPNCCYIKRGAMYRQRDSLHGWRENIFWAVSGFLRQLKWLFGQETSVSPYQAVQHCTCCASHSPRLGCCRNTSRQKCLGSGIISTWFLNSLPT